MKILIGTSNTSKVKEYEAILADPKFSGFEFEVAPKLDVDEPFKTFEKNAKHKATTYAKAFNQYVIAEDSGLVVFSLGLPGIYSARFAELVLGIDGAKALMRLRAHNSIFDVNRELILNMCKLSEDRGLSASYTIAIALADKDGNILRTFMHNMLGSISDKDRGENRFGYDPIFIPLFDREHTLGEISSEIKNLYSHRAKACNQLSYWLQDNKDKLK